MTLNTRSFVVPGFLAACLLLGGASAAGHMANLLLQLAAIAIIAWSLIAERGMPIARAARPLLAMLAAMLLIAALQLVPLPPALWTALPGREEVQGTFALLGLPLPWLPLSLTPDRTIAAILWLLPPVAILVAMVRAGAYRQDWLAATIIAVTLVAIALGAVQRSGNMAAYLYAVTNVGMGTGFFANGNHMATLLMCSIPFAAALFLSARARSRSRQHSSALTIMLAGAAIVLVIGIAINGSLAGLGLTVPVLGASLLLLLGRKRRIPAWSLAPLLLLTGVAVALVFTQPMDNDFTAKSVQDVSISRPVFFANTLRAAADFAPFGSGIGSFASVYPLYEDHRIITATYANHAHSDLLELLLETSVAGMALLAVFLLWWLFRTVAIWRSADEDPFARAATIASAAILGHSLVDYPLRTAAIAAVFAACCALMADVRPWVKPERSRRGRHLSAD